MFGFLNILTLLNILVWLSIICSVIEVTHNIHKKKIKKKNKNKKKEKKKKKMKKREKKLEMPGIEPVTFYMQSGRSITELLRTSTSRL